MMFPAKKPPTLPLRMEWFINVAVAKIMGNNKVR